MKHAVQIDANGIWETVSEHDTWIEAATFASAHYRDGIRARVRNPEQRESDVRIARRVPVCVNCGKTGHDGCAPIPKEPAR